MVLNGTVVMSDHSSQSSRSSSPTSSNSPSEDECEISCEGDLLVVRRMLGQVYKKIVSKKMERRKKMFLFSCVYIYITSCIGNTY